MKRRKFVTFLGGAVAACPLVARAQQPAMPVIGYLAAGARASGAQVLTVLLQHLDEAGYLADRQIRRLAVQRID